MERRLAKVARSLFDPNITPPREEGELSQSPSSPLGSAFVGFTPRNTSLNEQVGGLDQYLEDTRPTPASPLKEAAESELATISASDLALITEGPLNTPPVPYDRPKSPILVA